MEMYVDHQLTTFVRSQLKKWHQQMFEKFSNLDIDSAGRGGEYTPQVNYNMYCLPSPLTVP
jgi:hypothetical protein